MQNTSSLDEKLKMVQDFNFEIVADNAISDASDSPAYDTESFRRLGVARDYNEFLQSKIKIAEPETVRGKVLLHPSLLGHQRAVVNWALHNGRGLIANSFGLGKTRDQCDIALNLHRQTGKKFLQVCPLGVRHQFTHEDGPAMGMEYVYVRNDTEIEAATSPYLITNYERIRDGGIDPRKHNLCGASLDEGSVLRSLGSKTWEVFTEVFQGVPNRFVCTATPSPNKTRELIYYADWLGIMDAGQALTRFFMRNPDKAGDLQLHPQHTRDFWLWVASWALFLYAPSDLGFSDEGYDLPELRVHWHCVPVDINRAQHKTEIQEVDGQESEVEVMITDNRGQGKLVPDVDSNDVRNDAKERRATLDARLERMVGILKCDVCYSKKVIDGPDGEEIICPNCNGTGDAKSERHCLLWHHLDDEYKAIEKAIPSAVIVRGSQPLELREQRILDFAHGKFQYLATKPEIAGSGCNFQRHCSMNIFLGPSFRFEDFIQACHRTHRFLQKETVDIHIIYAETQQGIVKVMKEKWAQHIELSQTMRDIVREFGLSHEALKGDLKRRIGIERMEVQQARFTAVNNDCVDEMYYLADNSVGLIHTSIPFGNHYEYTTNYEDFGHNPSDEQFFVQMDFLIPELLRVLQPGRIAAIHVKDRILYGHQTKSGFMKVDAFSDKTRHAFEKHGFMFEGRITITTDVVRENNSSYRLGWTEMCKDGTKMGCGLPEYVLLFRKAPTDTKNHYADVPVVHSKEDYSIARWQLTASNQWQSSGKAIESYEPYDFEAHVARMEVKERRGELSKEFLSDPPVSDSPWVWDDVNFLKSLNAKQVSSKKIKHICPLAEDIVRRIIDRFSNPGDLVFEPFGGIGTVPYIAIKMGRKAYFAELNTSYFGDAVKYCRDAEIEFMTPGLFDDLSDIETSSSTRELVAV